MNFIRENLLKIVIIFGVVIVLIIIISSCSSKTIVNKNEDYLVTEQKMVSAAKKLVNKSSTFLPKDLEESKTIKLSTLINNNEINQIYANEDSNVVCSGFVTVIKKDENVYKYTPYLKCGKYYQTKSIADYIIDKENIVQENDGLYKSGEDFYYFRGENPNNYVLLDEILYRIISINSEKQIRVVSTKSYGSSVWDDRYNSSEDRYVGINNYEKSRIKEYLEDLYNSSENYFSPELKSMIVPHDICIGKRSENDNNNISGEIECREVSRNNKIGLIYTSEYLKASIDSGCQSGSNHECGNYNYFSNIASYLRTQTASADDSYQVYSIDEAVFSLNRASNSFNVFPAFYLDSNTLYKSGLGTKEKPYILR